MSTIYIVLLTITCALAAKYQINVERINLENPAISSQFTLGRFGSSTFKYNYNAAYAPVNNNNKYSGGLLVRCQNITVENDPYSVGPSVITFVPRVSPAEDLDAIKYAPIDDSMIVIEPTGPDSSFGTEDPRVVYREKDSTYYILYSSVANTTDGVPISRLSLITTKDLADKSSYVKHGPLFPDIKWSKSGSMLIRDGYNGPNYLIWGDSSIINGLQLATSTDLINWTNGNGIFLPTRPNMFDSLLVEAGPMPLLLSDGNYLFLYNSARHGYPSPKPNWDVQYNVGYLVLDGQNPTTIIERSDQPIFSPDLAWEIGKEPFLGLTPNVVFVEGWHAIENEPNSFVIYYGAADSVVGAAKLTVTFQN